MWSTDDSREDEVMTPGTPDDDCGEEDQGPATVYPETQMSTVPTTGPATGGPGNCVSKGWWEGNSELCEGIREKCEMKMSAVRTVHMMMDEVLARVECNMMMRSVVEELICGAMTNITHQETAYTGSNTVNTVITIYTV